VPALICFYAVRLSYPFSLKHLCLPIIQDLLFTIVVHATVKGVASGQKSDITGANVHVVWEKSPDGVITLKCCSERTEKGLDIFLVDADDSISEEDIISSDDMSTEKGVTGPASTSAK
jgi:hypothetical protein